jgi:LacI family repressor for deo operon, udp, cdd, tsx, nupC, and nupG
MTGRSKRKLHSNISIKEVAQSLNVSAATVSRALSRPELLNKETRVRILEAVERMGYRPNLIARGLRLKKTQLLFVVVPTLSPFFLEVFRGVERAARETNYSVLMGHTNREISRELIFIDQALAQRADGIVLVTSSSQNELVDRQGSLPPLVAALETISGLQVPAARVDHRKGSMDATNHLIALGHRRIAHIGGPDMQTIAQRRRSGFEAAMTAAKLDPNAYPRLAGDYSTALGESGMEALLTCHPRPTAVVAGNDEIAIGVIRTLKRVGLTVGQQVSVIGFDDQRIASLYEPALTTVRVQTEELGYQSAMLLIQQLAGAEQQEDLVLPTALVIRDTTGMAPV